MMPEIDGYDALKTIRAREDSRGILPPHGARSMMVTVLDHIRNVMDAFQGLCDAYVVKPFETRKLLDQSHAMALI